MKLDNTLIEVIDNILKTKSIPALIGEPGIGKSSALKALAKRYNTQCFSLACNQLSEKADLTGARLIETENKGEYKQRFFPHETIMDAIQYAKDNPRQNPILFLDEINRTSSDVTSALLSIPTDRKIGNVELPSNLNVVIAGNDKGNVTSLDTASISRFVLLHTKPDKDTFLDVTENVHPTIREVLNENPSYIFKTKLQDNYKKADEDDEDVQVEYDDFDLDDMSQITTPRTIEFLNKWLNETPIDLLRQLQYEFVSSDNDDQITVLQEVIEGFTGHTIFTLTLMEKLFAYINNSQTSNQTSMKPTIQKPQEFDDLKKINDVDDLNDYIANNFDDVKLSAVISYAIYEKDDNQSLLNVLIKQPNANITKEDLFTLASLNQNDELDHDNLEFIKNQNNNIAQTLNIIL